MPDKYDDFTASHIFTTDEEGNTVYTRDGIDYIVNDPKRQHKLRDLEGYAYFYYGTRKPVTFMLAFFFFAIPLTYLIKTLWLPNIDENLLPLPIALAIHTYVKYRYNRRIEALLQGLPARPHNAQKKRAKQTPSQKEQKVHTPITKPAKVQQHVTQQTSVPAPADKKPLLQKVHEIIADYNLFHLIMFLIIAAPFLYFIYAMIKASLTD